MVTPYDKSVIAKVPRSLDMTTARFKEQTGLPKVNFFRELTKQDEYHKAVQKILRGTKKNGNS